VSRDATTEVGPTREPDRERRDPAPATGLVGVWTTEGPRTLGALVPVVRPTTYGREGDATRMHQRPGVNVVLDPPSGNRLSRLQLRHAPLSGGRVSVERLGRASVRVRGERVEQAVLSVGDTLEVSEHALFLCVQRPERLPPALDAATLARFDASFGGPDPFGLVGESPALWALRDRLAFVAPRPGHVLVLGPSGVGKELVARAVHRLSTRAAGPFIARNAATIPASLADAELFGHARHYPNTGMPERPGLVGEADGGTLLLDEIGELPEAQQAHLLRLMDAGEYQRLGEPRTRHAQLRIVAATNRPPEALKPDFLARFRHVIEVPPLAARREDLPLLCRHLLERALSDDAALSARFSPDRVSVNSSRCSCAIHSRSRCAHSTPFCGAASRRAPDRRWTSSKTSIAAAPQTPPTSGPPPAWTRRPSTPRRCGPLCSNTRACRSVSGGRWASRVGTCSEGC
jgi:two-component system nitrogen regulation response regulator GlnG/two-component system response regulator HydG